jgi:cell fate regulator YaaT (PSP1 superfamily)
MKISDINFKEMDLRLLLPQMIIDFRALIKDFAKEFSTRIEMKQVGFRQEAARLGGIGSGKRIVLFYCCDFRV